eukprot:2176488-Rhodomonas_salina.1
MGSVLPEGGHRLAGTGRNQFRAVTGWHESCSVLSCVCSSFALSQASHCHGTAVRARQLVTVTVVRSHPQAVSAGPGPGPHWHWQPASESD